MRLRLAAVVARRRDRNECRERRHSAGDGAEVKIRPDELTCRPPPRVIRLGHAIPAWCVNEMNTSASSLVLIIKQAVEAADKILQPLMPGGD